MSQYTTGEMAKKCEVSVRTVQFYDTKGILSPTELSEGGRRLYSEEDLKKLKRICLLKSLGLSLESIKGVMESEAPKKILSVFLEEQKKQLGLEIAGKKKQLAAIEVVLEDMGSLLSDSENSINDIDEIMENKKKRNKLFYTIIGIGIILDLIEIGTAVYWILTGIWIPFAAGMVFVIAGAALIVCYYYGHVEYICPECNAKFQPDKWEFFWANHTPKLRKLTCTCCHKKGWCVETYASTREEQA